MYAHMESVGIVNVLHMAVISFPLALMVMPSVACVSWLDVIDASIVSFSCCNFSVAISNRWIFVRCFACNCSHSVVTSSSSSALSALSPLLLSW